MWMLATKDLEYFIPDSNSAGHKTAQDVTSKGPPRLFTTKDSAAKALGHWFNGPYLGYTDEGGWYYQVRTDENRRLIWGDQLAPRKVRIVSDE